MNQSSVQSIVKSSHPAASSTYRILVVDDLPDNYFLLQTVLEDEGYQVEVADSGFAALKQIEANPPDLVLLDVMMPEMNGFEVIRRIRQNSALPFIPVVLITGYTETSPTKSSNVDADCLIRKPIDFNELLTCIQGIFQENKTFEQAS